MTAAAPPEGDGPPPDIQGAASKLGLTISSLQEQQLSQFLRLLQRWNTVYNLTAVRDPALMLTHHLYDCLAVVAPLRRQLRQAAGRRLLDVGSGAGLPGVVLAAMDPSLSVVCVDAVGKKAAFVGQAAAELKLTNLVSRHARVEDLSEAPFDVIASRAYASLAAFIQSTQSLLAQGGAWLAMKGKRPTEELAALPPHIDVFHVEQVDVPGLAAERCLVWMKPLQ